MRSLLAFSFQSLLFTTIAGLPSKIPDPVLLDARETSVNVTTDFTLFIYGSPNCDQGKTTKNPLPQGATLNANHYDNQNAAIPGFGAFSSFTTNRDLTAGEVVDFSIYGTPYNPDPYCSLYAQTFMAPVNAGTCYTLNGPMTCYRIWHQ